MVPIDGARRPPLPEIRRRQTPVGCVKPTLAWRREQATIRLVAPLLQRRRIPTRWPSARNKRTRMKSFGWLAIALVLLQLFSGCVGPNKAGQADRCTMTIDSSSSVPSPGATTLDLVSIAPARGTTLRIDSVLSAELRFAVRDFGSGRFKIVAQFDTNRDGRTTDGTFKAYPFLTGAAGNVHFCFPMKHVWRLQEVKRPFVVRFFLNRMLDDKRSVVVAQTQTLVFPASADGT